MNTPKKVIRNQYHPWRSHSVSNEIVICHLIPSEFRDVEESCWKTHDKRASSLLFVSNNKNNDEELNRRTILDGASRMAGGMMTLLFSTATTTTALPKMAVAMENENNYDIYEYMQHRVMTKDVYNKANLGGLQVPDIYYPSWFKGVWSVSSTTMDIAAPCGNLLFAGGAVKTAAEADQFYQSTVKKEVGDTLHYKARFVTSTSEDEAGKQIIIADREYNVASIVAAAMNNPASFNMDVRSATPHLFSCYLGNSIRVDMLESQRAQSSSQKTQTKTGDESLDDDDDDANTFVCSEIVQQIVTPLYLQQSSSPSSQRSVQQKIKLIETTTVYTHNPNDGTVQADQKTFTYLVPSQDDLLALQLWRQSQGNAIDVRTYHVTYTKLS